MFKGDLQSDSMTAEFSLKRKTNNCETLLRVTLSQSSSKAKNILNIQLKVMQHQQQYQCMDTHCYFETCNYDLWPINYCACPVLFLNQGLMQMIILKTESILLNLKVWQNWCIMLKQLENPLHSVIKHVLISEFTIKEYCCSVCATPQQAIYPNGLYS